MERVVSRARNKCFVLAEHPPLFVSLTKLLNKGKGRRKKNIFRRSREEYIVFVPLELVKRFVALCSEGCVLQVAETV